MQAFKSAACPVKLSRFAALVIDNLLLISGVFCCLIGAEGHPRLKAGDSAAAGGAALKIARKHQPANASLKAGFRLKSAGAAQIRHSRLHKIIF
ncbi:hypothetical protein [Acinetobacter sp. WCHAc010034]|uniref:hypothetical protein n=1 Tax=Acinetobacter sp. WCHAc010034 TaxID=1879049 RepID=UPI001BC89A21|nr:hypothetical protein [Acinetobacter sp. WCHAc010034]